MARFSFTAVAALCLIFSNVVSVCAQDNSHQSGGEEHIVIIDPTHPAPPAVEAVLQRLALDPTHSDVKRIYNNSHFVGFSAKMSSHCLGLLADMSDISVVEKSTSVARAAPIKQARNDADAGSEVLRIGAPWGLQAITSSSMPTGDPSKLDFTYAIVAGTIDPDNNGGILGTDVDLYVLDTGIYTEHIVFGKRASMAWSYDPSDTADQDGHGTHVAGTAGGATVGVASQVNVFGVKALDGTGTGWSSNVIAGIDFVINQHEARRAAEGDKFIGSVLSMSLASGGLISGINQAVVAATEAGIHVVVAAGNEAQDACKDSPAASGGSQGPAITVGAIDNTGAQASFSNYGNCVDVWAPGVDVQSAWIGAPNYINLLSGTSMATPHVSGLVADLMSRYPTQLGASPALMKQFISHTARTLPNGLLLVNNGIGNLVNDDLVALYPEHYKREQSITALDFVDAGVVRPVGGALSAKAAGEQKCRRGGGDATVLDQWLCTAKSLLM